MPVGTEAHFLLVAGLMHDVWRTHGDDVVMVWSVVAWGEVQAEGKHWAMEWLWHLVTMATVIAKKME